MHHVISVLIAWFDIVFFLSQISPENESFQEITRCSFSSPAYENTQWIMEQKKKKGSHSHDFMFLWMFKCFASWLDTDPARCLSVLSAFCCNAISLIASTYACRSKTGFLFIFNQKVSFDSVRSFSTKVWIAGTRCHIPWCEPTLAGNEAKNEEKQIRLDKVI